jgi:hypothetical protein
MRVRMQMRIGQGESLKPKTNKKGENPTKSIICCSGRLSFINSKTNKNGKNIINSLWNRTLVWGKYKNGENELEKLNKHGEKLKKRTKKRTAKPLRA